MFIIVRMDFMHPRCISSGIALLILLLVQPSVTHSQGRDGDIRFKLAQSYERSGDFESAVRIYEELHKKDPANLIVIEALKRDYIQLKRYDDAIALIQKALSGNARDLNQLAQLGSILVQKSDEKGAWEAWEKALAIEPKRESTYRVVGNYIVQSRLFERAIEVYQRGRIACNDPLLFSNDIAYLYSVILKFPEATREYLTQIRQNSGQLGYVQSRISSFTGRADGLTAATTTVEEASKAEPENVSIQKLLAWLYMEGKQFDRAYSVYKTIDESTNANGRELFQFGEHALKEGAYGPASQAYHDIIGQKTKFEFLSLAKYGYARTLEELDAQRDTLPKTVSQNGKPATEATPLYNRAMTAYEAVVKEFPQTEIAARSMLRLAILKQEKFFDLDGAKNTLESIEKIYKAFPQVFMAAKLRLGDTHLALGNLATAEEQYSSLAAHQPVVGEEREKAALRLAELDYFRGRFKESLDKLKNLTRNSSADVANDAIALQIFIQENVKENEKALRDYAQADLLKRQLRLPESLQAFQAILKSYAGAPLIDETLMSIGDVEVRMHRFAEGIAAYERVVNEFPESLVMDRALMQIGLTYQGNLKETAKAIASYQSLLEKYPNSIYVSEARKRIRELRGDNI